MHEFRRRASGAPLASSLLFALLAAGAVPAQGDATQPTVRQAPPRLLAPFAVGAGTVQQLTVNAVENGDCAIQVMLGGQLVTMALRQHELRGPGFRLLVEDATGIHQVPTPACTTYRGELLEDPASKVVGSIVDNSFSGIVHRPAPGPNMPGEDWVVQPLREVDPTAGASVHVVYRAADNLPLPYQCGVATVPNPQPVPAVGTDLTYVCDIALEADIQYYQLNGSNVTATQNDVTAVMNNVDFVYDRDCDITYNITTILVSTTAIYTTNDPGTLLNQFGTRWNTVNAGIQRDVAHLFTGRNLTGGTIGIATLASICNLGSAYGLSQSRYTSNTAYRTSLTAHELGHGWSAQHCDSVSPCYIMCSGNGGCNGVGLPNFAPVPIAQITGFASTRPCLTTVQTAPVISSLNPSSVTVFNPGTVVLSGSGFLGATSFTVGTTVYSSGFAVVNDHTMNITMPQGGAIGPVPIRVTTPIGTSNSFLVSYVVTSPPKLKVTPSIPGAGGIASFDFAGTPGRQWLFVIGFFNSTSPFQGYPLLDSPILLGTGTFPAPLGIANVSIPVPGGFGLLFVYSQILEALSVAPVATGTSNIGVTILLP